MTFIASLIGAFAYRIRGGGWFTLSSDLLCRLIWGVFGLTLPYIMIVPDDFFIPYAIALIPLAFVAMLVPHAFAQNMGRWPTPQKKWPAFFLPTLTNDQWTQMPIAERLAYDFCGMTGVAFFRGLFVFVPYTLLCLAFGHADGRAAALAAVAVITIGQPVAYLLGAYFPFTITSSLQKESSNWGEFFNGSAWVISLAALGWGIL